MWENASHTVAPVCAWYGLALSRHNLEQELEQQLLPLRNHAAFEHLVGNGRCDLVDEGFTHLRIVMQDPHCSLFFR